MSDTTTVLNKLLVRFHAGDQTAKQEIIEHTYNRLLVLARGLLKGFPEVRRKEETAAIVNMTYERLSKAMDDLYKAPAAGTEPPTAAAFYGLAARNIRWLLQDLARKGKRGAQPRPDEVPIGPADSDGGGADPTDDGTDTSDVGRVLDITAIIEQLSEESRQAYDLIFVLGLTIEQAAEIAELSRDQMKRRWAAARVELGERLETYRPTAE
jgi:RNA polymerase sigma-70 factor (ECF subfamily)